MGEQQQKISSVCNTMGMHPVAALCDEELALSKHRSVCIDHLKDHMLELQ